MKKTILSFLILLGSLTISFAGGDITQTIRGRVTDEVTGAPLIGATVVIRDSDPVNGTITGMNGEFSFQNIPIGRLSLDVSYIGYHTAIISNLLLTSGKEVVVNIKLEEKAYQVEEITIRPDKKKEEANNEMAVVSARRFSVEETERFAGGLGDPARMVANYAGVMTQNDSRNDIIIRGNSPSGVLWRLEGIEIANPNHFGAQGTTGGPVSMVNNNLLADSDFLTGAFPAEFGNATAGAFDLNLRSGNNQKMEFTGQVGFNGFEGGIEGPFVKREKGPNPSFLANYRYSTLELVHDLGFSTGTGAAIPEYNDLTFLVDVPGTKAGRFKIFGLYGSSFIALEHEHADASDNAYNERGTTTDFGSDLSVTGVTHNIFLGENTRLSSTVSYQRTSSTTKIDSLGRDLEYIPTYRGEQAEDRFSLSTKVRHKINARNNISAGIIVDQYNVDSEDSIKSTDYDRFIILSDERGSLEILRAFADYQHLYNVPVKESFPEFSLLNEGDQFGLPREDSLVNEGKGRNYGLELTLEKFLDKGWYFLFTASLFDSKYQGYDKVWRNTAFNGNYVFNLLGGYEFKIGQKTMFTLDLKTVLAGGKRYLPVDIESSRQEDYTVYNYEKAYEDKYDPYFRTDLRLGLKMNGRRVSQEWGLDLQNLTNYQSIFMEGFDRNTGEIYQIYQQGFIPMFLYRIQF